MYAFTDEQLQLRESIRRFLSDNATTKRTRELMTDSDGFDRQTFQRLLGELGIGGIHVPEEYGGAGLTYIELCIALEEMGRTLYPSPYFASNVLAINAILLAGTEEQKANLLPRIVSGEMIATVAIYEDGNRTDLSKLNQTVVDNAFTGRKRFVIDGSVANLIVLIANCDTPNSTEPQFWLARTDDSGLRVTATESIDTTRRISQIDFTNVGVERLGAGDRPTSYYSHFVDLALVALANEMVGGAQVLLDSAVEYANHRVQFGRTISSMQAIKHKCADLVLEVELAKSAAYRSAYAAATMEQALPEYAVTAKAAANDAYMRAAADTIQIHGGIGFTFDNDTHFWFKRAKSSQVLFGTSEVHRELLLQRMQLVGSA